jgi:hypothetical protein
MKRLLTAALPFVALLVAAVPVSATPYPADPDEVGLDLPAVKGVCIAPCPVTAAQPAEGVDFDGQPGPFVYDANGTWDAQIWTGKLLDDPEEPGSTHHEALRQVLGPASPQISFTATTPGRWTVRLSSKTDPFVQSRSFFVLSRADAPASISLSPRKKLHVGSLLAVRSPKKKLAVEFQGSDLAPSLVKRARCKKPRKGVRCFKLRIIHRDMTSRAKISVRAWNPDSPQWMLSGGREGTDRRSFKVTLRCKRQRDYHYGNQLERQCR